MSGRTDRVQLAAAFAAIYLLSGGTYLAIALGLQSIPPFLLVGSRSILAGARCCSRFLSCGDWLCDRGGIGRTTFPTSLDPASRMARVAVRCLRRQAHKPEGHRFKSYPRNHFCYNSLTVPV